MCVEHILNMNTPRKGKKCVIVKTKQKKFVGFLYKIKTFLKQLYKKTKFRRCRFNNNVLYSFFTIHIFPLFYLSYFDCAMPSFIFCYYYKRKVNIYSIWMIILYIVRLFPYECLREF